MAIFQISSARWTPEKTEIPSTRPIGGGIVNTGNTCFKAASLIVSIGLCAAGFNSDPAAAARAFPFIPGEKKNPRNNGKN